MTKKVTTAVKTAAAKTTAAVKTVAKTAAVKTVAAVVAPKLKPVSKVKFFATLNKTAIEVTNIESKETRKSVLKSYHHQFILVGTVKVLLRHVAPVFDIAQESFQILDTLNGSAYSVKLVGPASEDLTKLF